MNINTDDDSSGLESFRVRSRREIINLLRNVGARKQLVRMETKNGADAAVTSILYVDDDDGTVIVDCASSTTTNRRIMESDHIAFETVLESIRILFTVSHAEECIYEGRPALQISLPESVVRLQRREYYRVMAPVSNPVRCAIPVPAEQEGELPTTLMMALYNVSAGGIAVVDEKKQLTPDAGRLFENCRIDLPGGPVVLALRLRNSQELTLSNGKSIRRIGFMFEDPSNAVLAAIQRYITKLEREQNARATGMA
jgi:flagellar brake protein